MPIKTCSQGHSYDTARGCHRCWDMRRRARRKALSAAAPPEGFVATHVTNDGEGKIVSVRSEPEGEETLQPVQPIGHYVHGVTTLLNGDGGVKLQYVKTSVEKERRLQLALDELKAHMAEYRGVGALPLRPVESASYAGIDKQVSFLLGDPHFGMLSWHLETGEDFDLKIAQDYMMAAVDLLVERTPPAASARIVNLGDFFHANDSTSRTPRGGNALDTDSRFARVVRVGYAMMRRIIDRARQKYPAVEVINLLGNHDPTIALTLPLWLEAVYEGDASVTIVDNADPYIVRTFGANATLYHHGDGAKPEQCKDVFAALDEGRIWGAHPYREIQGGHVHHLTRKEFPGVIFETSRTTAPADYWHHWKGYRAGRGMRSLVHHAAFGRLSEHSVNAREVALRVEEMAA